jgi:heat shock protein HtpX
LVCDACGGYYELQPDEASDDFSDECECGGKLEHKSKL